MNNKLSTDSYKGVRDFYPDDMAIQQYIFGVWSNTAESFGYERYDASVLEPSQLYKSKGAVNEEMVNEQTYTFTDRGDREVTLRPEMTPTVARMVSGKSRELIFPLRWYSIPNLFRYERAQRGRLREHWQLNCDIFGTDDYTADVEMIALAHQMLLNFGAEEDMFEIRINSRKEMTALYGQIGITDTGMQTAITRLNDRMNKISKDEYFFELKKIVKTNDLVGAVHDLVTKEETGAEHKILQGLVSLGITNAKIDRTIARGFDYYTDTVFEILDTADENNRAMLGGGRYDNLTEMFGGDAISGIGFGMGDVTMKDFLEVHGLLTADITSPSLMIIPTTPENNMEAQNIAQQFREAGLSVAVDMSTKKIGRKISNASDVFVEYVLVLGEDEIASEIYILKNLAEKTEIKNTLSKLITEVTT